MKSPTTRDFFLIFCYKLKSRPIPHAVPTGYTNISHSLVLCLNTTGEQPTCSCSTASPIQHQWEGKAWPGKGKTVAFPPVCVPALADPYLRREHALLKGGKRSEGSQNSRPRPAHSEGPAVGVCWATPRLPQHWRRAGVSHPGGTGSTPPASRSASPSAFCFTSLDMLLTSHNASICSSLSIRKRQQFPS